MGTRKDALDNLSDAYKTVRDATVLNDGLTHAESVAVLQCILHEASTDLVRQIYKDAMLEPH